MRRKMLWFSGLRHRMCSRRPRVNIVDNATGQAKMGELVGVLGPSGILLCPAFAERAHFRVSDSLTSALEASSRCEVTSEQL